jgi:hypothetical protein
MYSNKIQTLTTNEINCTTGGTKTSKSLIIGGGTETIVSGLILGMQAFINNRPSDFKRSNCVLATQFSIFCVGAAALIAGMVLEFKP